METIRSVLSGSSDFKTDNMKRLIFMVFPHFPPLIKKTQNFNGFKISIIGHSDSAGVALQRACYSFTNKYT
jgi:hypothetical protein